MPYEYNPLIKDCFQKKSEVTPSDIQQLQNKISELQDSSENLKLKKVTKFFSANDYLEDNEIAQFQGEDDAAHNLTNGFFYKKNPAFSIVSNEDSFAYSTAELLNVYDFDNNLALQQYYLDDINLSSDDYGIIGNNNYFTLVFNPNLFVNNTLPNSLLPGFVFYPYLNVEGIWDFANPVTILNGNYIYKGNIIQMSPLRFGLMGAVLAASMTSPYYRYLWIYILMETYVGVIAVNFCTNSSNILTALGVVNGLSCFGFLYRTTITPTPRVNFNTTGYILSENQALTAVQTDKVPEASESQAGLLSAADKMFINQISAQQIRIFYVKNYNFSDPASVEEACKKLITEINTTQKNSNYQIFEGTLGLNNLYLYKGSAYPTFSMLQFSTFTITNIASGSMYKFGYTGGTWYFNSL